MSPNFPQRRKKKSKTLLRGSGPERDDIIETELDMRQNLREKSQGCANDILTVAGKIRRDK
jgi:hypothetical protein